MKNLVLLIGILVFVSCSQPIATNSNESSSVAETKINEKNGVVEKDTITDFTNLSDETWQEILTEEEYKILRQKGTERAFTGKYNDNKKEGVYVCKGCGTQLFLSDTKFDSGTGWPSFYTIIKGNVEEVADNSYGMQRTEVVCNTCKGHLGHVFEDGPKPTGLRFCINSLSLDFKEL